VIDSRFSRFDGVSDLAVAEDGNSVYIAAGGGDQGISLFRLLPGGRLLHEGVQVDGGDTSLDGLAGMDLAFDDGGDLVLVTAGLRDGGISSFRLETAPQGLILGASDSGARLEGGARADVLSGGAGDDSLLGGGRRGCAARRGRCRLAGRGQWRGCLCL
jgi:Ca2+-binding RTX toxin-like protein